MRCKSYSKSQFLQSSYRKRMVSAFSATTSAPDHHRVKEKMPFGIEEENGRGKLPKALEIGRQNAFQQGGNEGRRLLHIPKKENALSGFLIRGCDLLLIDLRGGGQMRQRTEAVDDGSDICFQIRRAIQYPKERIKRRDFFI